MKKTSFVLFNNHDQLAAYESAKEFLEETSDEPFSENDIWDQASFTETICWEETARNLESFMCGKKFIIVGTNGLWSGKVTVADIIETYDDLRKAWMDCDYRNIYETDGHLYIQSSHHDGENHYELRELTERGIGYLERWENGDETEKRSYKYVMGKLAEPPYSRNANYAKWMEG